MIKLYATLERTSKDVRMALGQPVRIARTVDGRTSYVRRDYFTGEEMRRGDLDAYEIIDARDFDARFGN